MLPQNIIELRRRFLAKEAIALSDETDTTLADFMQQVQPIIHQLRPYGPAIQALREKDYTTEQIVAYLKLRGIVISTADFNEYMEKTRT
jgi:hypothetical protein